MHETDNDPEQPCASSLTAVKLASMATPVKSEPIIVRLPLAANPAGSAKAESLGMYAKKPITSHVLQAIVIAPTACAPLAIDDMEGKDPMVIRSGQFVQDRESELNTDAPPSET